MRFKETLGRDRADGFHRVIALQKRFIHEESPKKSASKVAPPKLVAGIPLPFQF
jgi:hypothetical protein